MRQRTQIPKGRSKLENNILVGYSLLDTKMETIKNNIQTTKGRQKN
jgi:hypothetical protein